MAAFTSNIDITSGGTYNMNITNGEPASQVATDLNGKFANIQQYLQNGLPEVWTGESLPDSLPDGKLIQWNNNYYGQTLQPLITKDLIYTTTWTLLASATNTNSIALPQRCSAYRFVCIHLVGGGKYIKIGNSNSDMMINKYTQYLIFTTIVLNDSSCYAFPIYSDFNRMSAGQYVGMYIDFNSNIISHTSSVNSTRIDVYIA